MRSQSYEASFELRPARTSVGARIASVCVERGDDHWTHFERSATGRVDVSDGRLVRGILEESSQPFAQMFSFAGED